jgi:hypothetical protein
MPNDMLHNSPHKMVIFFMADLTLTVVFKLSAWCLGKTWDGIAYLIAARTNPKPNDAELVLDDDCVIISRDEYRALKDSYNLHHASSEEVSTSASSLSASSSK